MYCRFQANTTTAYGYIEGDHVRQIEGDLLGLCTPTEKTYALNEVRLLVPTQPSKVLALAGNYRSHLDPQTIRKNPEVSIHFTGRVADREESKMRVRMEVGGRYVSMVHGGPTAWWSLARSS